MINTSRTTNGVLKRVETEKLSTSGHEGSEYTKALRALVVRYCVISS